MYEITDIFLIDYDGRRMNTHIRELFNKIERTDKRPLNVIEEIWYNRLKELFQTGSMWVMAEIKRKFI